MTRLLFAAALMTSSAALATSELVGPESCRTCHKEAYDAWRTSAHAKAHLSLNAEQRKNPLCLQCHSRDEMKTAQAQVVGVSCETCHGPGRSYQPEVVMRDKELARLVGLQDVTPQSCLACHNADSPSLKAFDPKEAMGRMDHWTVEREKRKQTGTPKAMILKAPQTQLAAWLRQSAATERPPARQAALRGAEKR